MDYNLKAISKRLSKATFIALIAGCSLAAGQQFADVKDVQSEKIGPSDPALKNAKYLNETLPIEARIDDLLSHLSMEEKAEIIHGASGYSYGKMPRIGLQEMGTYDGPQGIRLDGNRTSTAYPSGIAMAATWNPELIRELGKALAEECLAANGRVALGPGVNIMRTPLGGRSYEYSGEDPLLAGKIAARYIEGLQENKVAACLKHWILNDQEWARTIIDVQVGERALREIYARPYEIAIKEANPWSIMTSYNKVRGSYPSTNYTLNRILYDDYKWDGALISDWGAWHGDINAINGGCTICMPSGKSDERNAKIVSLVTDGTISKEMFDEAVRRNLRMSFRVEAFNKVATGKNNTPEQAEVALKTAQESIVLLKNEQNMLPLNLSNIRKIAIIGPNADQYQTMADGSNLPERGGAGAGRGEYEITPLKAIVDKLGKDKVLYAPGFRFERPRIHSCPELEEMDPVQAAREADLVLFFGGVDHSYDRERLGWGIPEGADKPDLNLKPRPDWPKPDPNKPEQAFTEKELKQQIAYAKYNDQADLILQVLKANPRTVVVLTTGAPVQVEEWQEQAPSILCTWYGGQEAGKAVSSVLFGEVNPSGKLPCTFGKKLSDWLCHELGQISYPGVTPVGKDGKKQDPYQVYSDYIWVGYRHFDKANIEPRYPFGYGLSYTTFSFSEAKSNNAGEFSVTVTNTGKREGAEVVQCYLSKPSDKGIPMPVRELVNFRKVNLKPGQSETVSFTITDEDKRYWDESGSTWKILPGKYSVSLGNSSRNLPVNYTWEQ